jgi:hypothetical protein
MDDESLTGRIVAGGDDTTAFAANDLDGTNPAGPIRLEPLAVA